jgi:hypothetical protein
MLGLPASTGNLASVFPAQTGKVAEREGFEPSVPLRTHMISNHAHSTTLPPLRVPDGQPVRRAKGKIKGHPWGQGQMHSPRDSARPRDF